MRFEGSGPVPETRLTHWRLPSRAATATDTARARSSVRSSAPPRCSTTRSEAASDASRAVGSASNWPSCLTSASCAVGPARAAGLVERLIDVGEIEHMRAVHDRGAELDRLDRILPAMRHQRAAHEHDRRQAIEQPEFAHGVGDIDVGRRGRQFLARAQADAQARRRRRGRAIASPRSGCRGTITVNSPGKNPASVLCASISISSSPGWVEAATITGRPRVIAISCSSLA